MPDILIGFPDEEVAPTPPTAFDNFIGGQPASLAAPESFPSATPECPNCDGPTSFVMQLYCPVNANDRVLYFFSCPRKDCQVTGCCWRVFRLSSKLPESLTPLQEDLGVVVTNCEWKLDEDDGENDSDVWFDPSLTVNTRRTETSHAITHLISPFKCHYIQVYDETDKDQSEKSQNSDLSDWVLDYHAEAEFVEEDESVEYGNGNDVTFTSQYQLHLATRDPRYGCEPVRYAWVGQPIFTTAAPCDEWAPHLKCPRCGGRRVFEVQLFSTLNNYLSNVKEKGASPGVAFDPIWPLQFSTLIVFSCLADCPSEEWVEECALVQTERGESVFSSGN
ncbi:Programmed cell death protein 2-like protein [Echinococcus granulosus]|uniref:Programmed cell death protein 2 n=1 Tax=Echinococcus granulosus TaxID=6210 RepID=U6J4F5_ECHGR|nr:Programmed cell death protein 2-like protein [Echinococcus granulosus]EUB64531.1 Programmed cell death protein 2-like protein [Echinococcus granulosus]CDS16613.1 programmed cell death protein 2 [Echinococcus granulosus]